jgi:hypothetical protein
LEPRTDCGAAAAVVRDALSAPSLPAARPALLAEVAAVESRGGAVAAEPAQARSAFRLLQRAPRLANSNPDSLSSPARHKPNDFPMQFELAHVVLETPYFLAPNGICASVRVL